MNLTDPIFQDAGKARQHLEATRWPNGPICPHCGLHVWPVAPMRWTRARGSARAEVVDELTLAR